uniref:Uncharacterized protein TCIL3000_10_8520 n=1 Tax=Trypanosoma congolense (strain IL3000) TaxID=1068625 RepID=G0UXF9_TRYCI|nr:unnamed protein product [Trypanosoma congolense IL3000]
MDSHRKPLLSRNHAAHAAQRQSFTSRISLLVAQRLSVVGIEEEPRYGTVAGATVNTLCNVVGAGVLSLPLALHNASIVGGFVLLFFMAILGGVAAYMVIVGCEATKRFSFAEVVAHALFPAHDFEEFCLRAGKPVSHNVNLVGGSTREIDELHEQHKKRLITQRLRRRIIIVLLELLIFFNNYGTLIIYSRVIGDSMPPVVRSYLHASGIFVTRTFWLVTSGVIFFFLSCARHMDELKWTSLLGFLTILYIVVVVAVRYVTSLQPEPYPNVDPAALAGINWYHISLDILRTVSTYSIAFSYHSNIPYFYRELKDRQPSNMLKSVYIAFPIITACYATTGLLGYLTFGTLVAAPSVGGDIVRNYPADDDLVNIGRLGLFFHFACVYPILSVCARRGLHRVIMHALTWTTLTSKYMGNEDAADENTVYYTVTRKGRGSSFIGGAETLDDIDRDVGSPEDTTTLAIVLEAFFIVSTSVLFAAYVSGISVVIDFLGTLLGTVMMFSIPGLAGWCIASRAHPLDFALIRRTRLFMTFAFLLILTGVVSTVIGVAVLIQQYAFPSD